MIVVQRLVVDSSERSCCRPGALDVARRGARIDRLKDSIEKAITTAHRSTSPPKVWSTASSTRSIRIDRLFPQTAVPRLWYAEHA